MRSTSSRRLDRLDQLVKQSPLEPLAAGGRPNARQRTEAARQIPLWFVARACQKQTIPTLRERGEHLATLALEAARRQSDLHWLLAMLREQGEIAFEHHDVAKAEALWTRMLSLVTAVERARVPRVRPARPAAGYRTAGQTGGDQGKPEGHARSSQGQCRAPRLVPEPTARSPKGGSVRRSPSRRPAAMSCCRRRLRPPIPEQRPGGDSSVGGGSVRRSPGKPHRGAEPPPTGAAAPSAVPPSWFLVGGPSPFPERLRKPDDLDGDSVPEGPVSGAANRSSGSSTNQPASSSDAFPLCHSANLSDSHQPAQTAPESPNTCSAFRKRSPILCMRDNAHFGRERCRRRARSRRQKGFRCSERVTKKQAERTQTFAGPTTRSAPNEPKPRPD